VEVWRQENVTAGRFVAGSIAVTAVVLTVVAFAGLDLSALRDFERDVTMLRAPYTEGDRYFDPSGHSVWLPSDLFVWDSIRRGELPLWDRMQGGGFSSLNAIHEGVFHPLRWLTALVPRRSAATALIVLVLAATLTGMFVLARWGFSWSIPAAALAAFVFSFSGPLISMVHFSGMILPLAHIPWIVYFMRRSPARGAVAGLVIAMALLFVSGHPLLELTAALAVGGIAIADGVVSRSLGPVIRCVTAGFGGVLIAAPAWLPAVVSRADLWTYKTQTTVGMSYFAYGLLDWVAATQAILLDSFSKGSCCIDLGAFFLYVGPAAVTLVAIGMIAAKRMRPIGMLLAIAFLLSVPGPWMKPLRTLLFLAPFKPWYLIGAMAFYLALCAGAGFDTLWRSTTLRRVIAAALATLVVGTYLIRAGEVVRPRILQAEVAGDALRFLRSDREFFRVLGLWGQTHMPNASRLTAVEDIRLVGPILSRRYHLFWQLVDRDVLSRSYPTTRVTDHLESPLVGDFNVKYILQSRLAYTGTFRLDPRERSRDTRLSPLLADLPVVARTPWVEVRQNTRWFRPRAHFAEAVVQVSSLEQAVGSLLRDGDLPRHAEVVESEEPLTGAAGGGTVAVSYPSERSVAMNVRSDRGGLVVLHDSFADGWSATVDGKPAGIYPVNVLSRGVMVPPGGHRILMTYLPGTFLSAVGISAAALLTLLLVILRTVPSTPSGRIESE
jgi:hypothetical protein